MLRETRNHGRSVRLLLNHVYGFGQWKAAVRNPAGKWPRVIGWPTIASRSKDVVEVSLSGRSVEGSSHIEAERVIMDGQWKGAS